MSIFIGQQCASLLTPRSSQMCLLFLVRPTRGRSMGDVLSPQSFGLRPPTGGYDSSDLLRRSQTMCIRNMDPSYHLLRRSQTMCIRNMDPSYHLLCGGHKRCVSAIWILRITSSAEVTTDDNDVSLSGLGRSDRSAVGRILAPSRRGNAPNDWGCRWVHPA